MNTEEYNIKIKELRKERDFHQEEYQRLMKEMDELSIDQQYIDVHIEKYIKLDRRLKGGYLEFFHVDHWEKRPRGIDLYGSGFVISDFIIKINDSTQIFIELDDISKIEEITEEEFYTAFDNYVKLIREKLGDYKHYKKLSNGFNFKNSLISGMIEQENKESLSNQVLNSLNK